MMQMLCAHCDVELDEWYGSCVDDESRDEGSTRAHDNWEHKICLSCQQKRFNGQPCPEERTPWR